MKYIYRYALTAAHFIATVDTVILVVAVKALRYALVSGPTAVLAVATRRTGRIRRAAAFIGIVTAVVIAVTQPRLQDASLVRAPEFVWLTSMRI